MAENTTSTHHHHTFRHGDQAGRREARRDQGRRQEAGRS